MKRAVRAGAAGLFMLLVLAACGGQREPANMELVEIGGKSAIIWEDRTYYPFCVVSKNDRGEQLGCLNGEQDHRVSAYKGYPPEEWLVSWLTVDGGAILYKEETVVDIPDGLVPEYEERNICCTA